MGVDRSSQRISPEGLADKVMEEAGRTGRLVYVVTSMLLDLFRLSALRGARADDVSPLLASVISHTLPVFLPMYMSSLTSILMVATTVQCRWCVLLI